MRFYETFTCLSPSVRLSFSPSVSVSKRRRSIATSSYISHLATPWDELDAYLYSPLTARLFALWTEQTGRLLYEESDRERLIRRV